MPRISEQVEWLNLVDRSGPFLEAALLETVFPQGLEKIESFRRQRIRSAYEEWRDAMDDDDPQLYEMHSAWILMVLQDMLEYEDAVLVSRQALDGKCVYRAPEHGAEAVPDYAIRGDDGRCRMLISVWSPGIDLEKPVLGDLWPASPLERMTLLCRANEVRVGMVTNGEQWMVVNAPVGATSGYVAWLARLWWQEPLTLRAFQSLLGVRRCFGPKEDTLSVLLERSAEFQGAVTDTLGEQVRRAVEILIQSLGRADQDRNGDLLKDVRPSELYEAGLTVMMRMVFTLCAEERGLLLLGDPTYDQFYAISTLRARLREDADRFGVEVLERRHDAWSRMLAVFRSIYGGVEHESLRMPALGGSLFDPDRFPMLEGRAKETTWRDTPSVPLPIDNRTVLLLLDALLMLEQKGGAQLLSYRALDVEQIGHVYEGLLEYTVAKLDKVTIGLVGSQKVRHPSITLSELEALKTLGQQRAVGDLAERTGRSATAIGRALDSVGDDAAMVRLVNASGGDEQLAHRLLPFANLIQSDSWGTLLIYKPGSFAVVHGSDRRETGTHYTPKSLTESIVEKTLEPIVYVGPAEGEPRERWKLKSPAELLDLKVCDPAMGSGAFLVQVCRYLSERLVEAWAQKEAEGKAITADGVVLESHGESDPIPKSLDERLIIARRLIAERCLYGVDINPLAVELAKLSIWLVTMARGRPFGFLDHNLRSGDSLLGIHRLDQLTKLTMNPDEPIHQQRLFGQNIGKAVEEAAAIRAKLRAIPIRDIRDVEMMAHLNLEAQKKLEALELIGDAMIGEVLAKSGQLRATSSALDLLAVESGELLTGNRKEGRNLQQSACVNLSSGLPEGKPPRRPFHWPLQFAEVFQRENGGFDALVENPPFMGGLKLETTFGSEWRAYLVDSLAKGIRGVRGTADLCAYFLLRSAQLLRIQGTIGTLATNTISQGDTREVGLEQLLKHEHAVFRAIPSFKWPGKANLEIAEVWLYRGTWKGQSHIDDQPVNTINCFLKPSTGEVGQPESLTENSDKAFVGALVVGMGFILEPTEAQRLLQADAHYRRVLMPYLNGEDLNTSPSQLPSRWVINFFGFPLDHETAPEEYEGPVATDFPECLAIIRERVMPERMSYAPKNPWNRKLRSEWWLFGQWRWALYSAIASLKRVLVRSRVANINSIAFAPTDYVFSDAVVVFAFDTMGHFAVLQSFAHTAWLEEFSSSLRTDVRYTPSSCFDTFPRPSVDGLHDIGDRYYTCRQECMARNDEGLTKTYNRFHNPSERSESIVYLRTLQAEMDQAVAVSYGWSDLDLAHGFHGTRHGERYAISETARKIVLDRLLARNHQRHEEVTEGLHDKSTGKATDHPSSKSPSRRRSKS